MNSFSQEVALDRLSHATSTDDLDNWVREVVLTESREGFGLSETHPAVSDAVAYFKSNCSDLQQFRFNDLRYNGLTDSLARHGRILDVASGFGQFCIEALKRGIDCWGLEPDPTRLEMVKRKLELENYPREWANHFCLGVAEKMPFPSDHFDYITSFQTMEHVQDLDLVCDNLLRCVRSGGRIHIRCPDYMGTYEGHYCLPMIPYFKTLNLVLYRILGRPSAGFKQLNFITKRKLFRALSNAAHRQGIRITTVDNVVQRYRDGLMRRGFPTTQLVVFLCKVFVYGRSFWRAESSIDVTITVMKRHNS